MPVGGGAARGTSRRGRGDAGCDSEGAVRGGGGAARGGGFQAGEGGAGTPNPRIARARGEWRRCPGRRAGVQWHQVDRFREVGSCAIF
uniref:Uncharacterized protein n=1 Tax=Arundo donax TaxID=35708 RepID=A0A0A9DBZ5_ARUDO